MFKTIFRQRQANDSTDRASNSTNEPITAEVVFKNPATEHLQQPYMLSRPTHTWGPGHVADDPEESRRKYEAELQWQREYGGAYLEYWRQREAHPDYRLTISYDPKKPAECCITIEESNVEWFSEYRCHYSLGNQKVAFTLAANTQEVTSITTEPALLNRIPTDIHDLKDAVIEAVKKGMTLSKDELPARLQITPNIALISSDSRTYKGFDCEQSPHRWRDPEYSKLFNAAIASGKAIATTPKVSQWQQRTARLPEENNVAR